MIFIFSIFFQYNLTSIKALIQDSSQKQELVVGPSQQPIPDPFIVNNSQIYSHKFTTFSPDQNSKHQIQQEEIHELISKFFQKQNNLWGEQQQILVQKILEEMEQKKQLHEQKQEEDVQIATQEYTMYDEKIQHLSLLIREQNLHETESLKRLHEKKTSVTRLQIVRSRFGELFKEHYKQSQILFEEFQPYDQDDEIDKTLLKIMDNQEKFQVLQKMVTLWEKHLSERLGNGMAIALVIQALVRSKNENLKQNIQKLHEEQLRQDHEIANWVQEWKKKASELWKLPVSIQLRILRELLIGGKDLYQKLYDMFEKKEQLVKQEDTEYNLLKAHMEKENELYEEQQKQEKYEEQKKKHLKMLYAAWNKRKQEQIQRAEAGKSKGLCNEQEQEMTNTLNVTC